MRKFETGSFRNDEAGKIDYEGFLSPDVIKAFGEYMDKHRKMEDGTLRDSDNWQKGFPYSVLMKSLWRHFMDLWLLHRGGKARETIDDAICGILFNTMAYYHQILNEKRDAGS